MVLVLAASCGRAGDGTAPNGDRVRLVDTAEVENVLLATQRRSSPDLSVGPASCPAGVPVAEGATLECSVAVEGVSAPYLVTVHDAQAPAGLRYDVRPAKAILLVSRVEDAIARSVPSPEPAVECGGPRVRVMDIGSTFDCTLSHAQRTATVRVRVETVEGRVSFEEA